MNRKSVLFSVPSGDCAWKKIWIWIFWGVRDSTQGWDQQPGANTPRSADSTSRLQGRKRLLLFFSVVDGLEAKLKRELIGWMVLWCALNKIRIHAPLLIFLVLCEAREDTARLGFITRIDWIGLVCIYMSAKNADLSACLELWKTCFFFSFDLPFFCFFLDGPSESSELLSSSESSPSSSLAPPSSSSSD